MKFLSLVSFLPTVLETKQEDVFNPVVVIETFEKQIVIIHNSETKHTPQVDPEIENEKKEKLEQQLCELNKKNEYLSSNIIETNSHLLSIYKRLRSLESEAGKAEQFKKENVFLFQKLKRVEDENIRLQKQSQNFNITNKTLEDELICMKHKIEKFDNFGEELILLKNKLENIGRFE